MTEVCIYCPAKTAMQSGRGRTQRWMVEFDPQAAREIDPLMGWVSTSDTTGPLRLQFASKEAAVLYCQSQGLSFRLNEPNERHSRAKNYADNFRTDKIL